MSDESPGGGSESASAQMLERLVQRFKSAIDLCNSPISDQPSANWSMNDDKARAQASARAGLWDLLVFDRMHQFPVRTRWYFDTELEFAEPSEMARQIVVNRSYDPNEFHLLDRILQEGMTFVDIGANFGAYTVFASKKVGTTGSVVSFEPSRREQFAIRRNIEINKLSNVQVFPFAVADTDTTELFSVADAKFSGHSKLGKLALFPTMPTLRLSTDLENFHWTSLNNGVTAIPIGHAGALEILIYSDDGFEFSIRNIQVLPASGSAGPWPVQRSEELPLDIPPQMSNVFAPFHARVYGDIQFGGVNQLRLHGRGKAGAAFRCRLDPANEYTLVIDGQGRPATRGEQYPVDVVRLDSVLFRKPFKSIDVVKIDIEGSELRALRGATDLIETFKPLLLVEIVESALRESGTTSSELGAFFASYGYVLFDVVQGKPRIIDLVGSHGSNVFAVPGRFLDTVLHSGGLDRSALAPASPGSSRTNHSRSSNDAKARTN